jgi:hypothetical protein
MNSVTTSAVQSASTGGRQLPTQAAVLERAIVHTVAYADVFDYALTADEIHRYLIGVSASRGDVRGALTSGRLVGQGQAQALSRAGRYFTLAGRESAVDTRRRRAAVSAAYWRRAVRYGRLIGNLPFVRMVAVTGGLAMDNVADDDIDYMVVTEPGRLWLCRALVVSLVRAAAFRRVTLCPNYFLSERALALDEQNLFTAHEVTQMVPLSGMPAYEHFRQLNRWTAQYLPNAAGAPRRVAAVEPTRRRIRSVAEHTLRSPVGAGFERWEMARKMRKLGLRADGHAEAAFGPDWCKGHFGDHGQLTLSRYAERLSALEARAHL